MSTHRFANFIPFMAQRPKIPAVGDSIPLPQEPSESPWQKARVEIQQPSPHEHSRASLLGLPQELRDNVYRYCIPETSPKFSLLSRGISAKLRLVCRQIYHETDKLIWTHGTLFMHTLTRGDIVNPSFAARGIPFASIKRVAFQSKIPHQIIMQNFQVDKSELVHHLKPTEIVIPICSCDIRSTNTSKYLRVLAVMRDKVTSFVGVWPTVESVTFLYCDDSDPATVAHFPRPINNMGPDWRFPASFRSAFEQDARYFGPWNPEKKKDTKDGQVQWDLKKYGRKEIERTVRLDFFNVTEVYGTKCVFDTPAWVDRRSAALQGMAIGNAKAV
jgi:hypothetical protein